MTGTMPSVAGRSAAARAGAPISAAAVRPYEPADRPAVVDLFWATLALGAPPPIPPGSRPARAYTALCLDWYLGPGHGDAAVAVDGDGVVVAYALVCTDEGAHARWTRRAAARFGSTLTRSALTGHLSSTSRTFYRHRVRDAMALARAGRHTAVGAHAHLNVGDGARTATVAAALRDHIDRRVALAGHARWTGEINAPVGRRGRALERIGFELVGREHNHTLTWVTGTPVERLTIVRTVPPAGAPGAA